MFYVMRYDADGFPVLLTQHSFLFEEYARNYASTQHPMHRAFVVEKKN